MDLLEILGDYVHLLGMTILLAKLWFTKNCAGISGKSQLLYAIVFTTRYMDLAKTYISLYNTTLKVAHIIIIYSTVLSIFIFFRNTYDRKHDAFRIELLLLPCMIFGILVNRRFETFEVFWTFSQYLEAVAIVPQVYLISKLKQVELIVISYVSCLGLYHGCYIMHWLYMYLKKDSVENIAVASSIVQVIFFCDLFARNLPILKQNRCESNLPTLSERDKEISNQEVTGPLTKNQQPAVDIFNEVPPEEKITLLMGKKHGSN